MNGSIRTALALAACTALSPLGRADAQSLPAPATFDGDVRNAVCSNRTDPVSVGFTYLFEALFNDTTNPTNVQAIPRRQVFVPDGSRAGLTQKRIVMFGDWFGMPNDTPPYVGDELRGLLSRADMVLNNIESPISWNNGVLEPNVDGFLNFHENVAYIKSSMAQLCIDPAKAVFTVANNHAGDRAKNDGTVRWPETVTSAPKLNATIVGMDNNPASRAPEITVKDLGGGVRVGIVGWTHIQNNPPVTGPIGPDTDSNGVKYPTWEASRRVFEQPASYWEGKKAELGIDLLIGVPHWDCQWHWYPRKETVQWADELHQKGFDLIAGGHPGLQPGKVHAGNELTFYSMGGLNNGLGYVNNYLAQVFEVVVDQNGRTLEYTVHPFVQHRVDATFNWLRATPLCGTKLYFDQTRQTEWKMIPLDALRNTSDVYERAFYNKANSFLDKVFP